MIEYFPRVVDGELDRRLASSGAVLIEGPKGCGKTETASKHSKSVVRFDTNPAARAQVDLDPSALFDEPIPILFDEWQRAPQIWDHVRRHVDDLRRRGLYILTGSATPTDSRELHSGAGRISTLRMRPMSLFESGHSTGEVSLAALLQGEDQGARLTKFTVSELMERIVIGGWPTLLGEDEPFARLWLTDYLSQIVEVDIPSLGTTRRAPDRLRRTLAALARGVGQPIKLTELATDISGSNGQRPAKETVTAYLDALDRLKLTENSPPWRPHMRSRTQLREAPVRYFIDPSIGTAALGVGSKDLLADPNAAGFHFESLVLRDLHIYSQPLDGMISTWREAHGRKEIDAIVQTQNTWAAIEIKLAGNQSVVDSAARSLLDFSSEIDTDRHGNPAALIVVTATGGGGKRADGVHVVPITALGP
jgi:predicted AAA+ superfamily ATPase